MPQAYGQIFGEKNAAGEAKRYRRKDRRSLMRRAEVRIRLGALTD